MDKDKEHKIRWSYSRTASFHNCKYEYYLNYIVHDNKQYLSEGNYYAEVGSYIHSILEMIFKGELEVDDALEYYLKNYNKNICYKVKKETMKKNYLLLADYFAELDIDWINDYEILGVELKTNFKLDDYDFIGYIDLLLRDKRDGKIVVIDHKSTDYPFKADGGVKKKVLHSFEKYKRQMYLYAYAVYQLYGEYPKEMTWNHFKNGGKFATIPFIKKEYDETMQWFRQTIHDIEKEETFAATKDYFYCNTLCNFRNSCEYNSDNKWRKKKKWN